MQQATVRQRTQSRHIFRQVAAEDVLRCGIVLIAARASVLGTFPFGVACFAALMDAETAYLGILAVGLGIWSAGASFGGALLSCGLFWLYTELRLREKNPLISMLVCGLCVFVGGLYGALTSGSGMYAVILLILKSGLAGISYHVFRRGVGMAGTYNRAAGEDLVCGVIVLGILLMGVSGIVIPPGAELSLVAGVLIVLSSALHMELSHAGCFGLCIGFICCMNRPWAVLSAGVFGISSVFANLLKDFGGLGSVLGFLIGITASLFYVGDFSKMPLSVVSLFFGCILFALMPQALHRQIGTRLSAVFADREKAADRRIKRYVSGELKSFAKIFRDLADQFLRTPAPDCELENKQSFFDAVAARSCAGCEKEQFCWGEEAEQTRQYAYQMMECMEQEGTLNTDTLPIVFRNRCIRPAMFAGAFCHVYELSRRDTLHQGAVFASQALVARQYDEISNMIHKLSYTVESGFCFLEDCERKITDRLAEAGIFIREVSVTETPEGGYAVELVPGVWDETATEIISEVLGTPMEPSAGDANWCKLTAACRYTVELGIRKKTKAGETVCGDALKYFETKEHKFFVILCDGMGSGEAAGAESMRTAGLFAKLLENQIPKETALNLINAALALRPGEERFTTVDLLEIDLHTGEVSCLKMGAAPGYIRHRGETETIVSPALPAGILAEIQPGIVARKLEDGDVFVLASDGISEAGHGAIRGEWIRRAMQTDQPMDALAEQILEMAQDKAYPQNVDDMTVACIQLHKK